MRLAIFYHCWVDGQWQHPFEEFCDALTRAVVPRDEMFVNRSHATSEAPTINALRGYAQAHDGAVLYAHTKGASDPSGFRARWRRSMTGRVIDRWRENVALLENADAVGCHWLTEAEHPGMFGAMTVPAKGSGFFGGNFWIARCDYLRTLPACEQLPRWRAEEWIGINRPRVVDLLPGWPHDNRWPELCE